LAKWANANHALPDHIEVVLREVHRAVEVIEDCANAVSTSFVSDR